jgi:hypothetical protein
MVPATLIGRLAVSTVFHGAGLGEILLMDALQRYENKHRSCSSCPEWEYFGGAGIDEACRIFDRRLVGGSPLSFSLARP